MRIDPLFNEHCVKVTAKLVQAYPIKPPQLPLQINVVAEASNWKPKL